MKKTSVQIYPNDNFRENAIGFCDFSIFAPDMVPLIRRRRIRLKRESCENQEQFPLL